MNKKSIVIVVILSIIFGLLYMITSTYSVIINATEENGVMKILNQITIRKLLTNSDGSYNQIYYDVKRELDITDDESEILMDSKKLNENLQIVLNSVVNYKIKNNDNAKLSNEQIYSLILDGLNDTNGLSLETRDKILDKSSMYLDDIANHLYGLEVSYNNN